MRAKEMIGNIIAKTNAISERSFIIGMFSILFVVTLADCFHGLDLTDRGWVLSGYQQIFAHPENVESMFYIYDTLLIGGLWELLFGNLGVIGFNVLSGLFMIATYAIIYVLLRDYFNRWILFWSFLILTIGQISVFSYNVASVFFAMLSICFIFNALRKNSQNYMFIAGIVLGMSLFVRFPNLALTGLIMVLIVYYSATQKITDIWKLFFASMGGYITGTAINIMLLFVLNHVMPMLSMMDITFSMLSSSDSTHSMERMLTLYFSLYKRMLTYMYPIVFFACMAYIIDRWEDNNKVRNILLILCGCAFCLLLVTIFNKGSIAKHGLCCLAFILVLLKRKAYNINILYLSTLSFLLMFLMPIGSDGGIGSAKESVLFALPLSMGIFWKELENADAKWGRTLRVAVLSAMCLILVNVTKKSFVNSYRDTGSKFQKTAMVTKSYHPTTYTNPEKAAMLDDLLEHLNPLLREHTELLAYPSIPGIHYLSNTISYINAPWPGILNDAVFDMEFEKAQRKAYLPIIVINKALHGCWYEPLEHWESVLDCKDWQDISHKNEYLQSFLSNNNYSIVYNSAQFAIYQPSSLSK